MKSWQGCGMNRLPLSEWSSELLYAKLNATQEKQIYHQYKHHHINRDHQHLVESH